MAIDPTFSSAAFAAAEASIQQLLQYDPSTRIALANLHGQVLALDISAPKQSVYLVFDRDGLKILGHYEQEVNTRLRGSLVALSLLLTSDNTSLANSGVEVFGSTALLVKLQSIAGNVEIDWEEPLTQILGDLLGHQSAEYLRWRFGWLQARLKSGLRLGSEFLTEELACTPPKPEAEYFYDQVDALRLDTDRLEARLNALLARAQTFTSTST